MAHLCLCSGLQACRFSLPAELGLLLSTMASSLLSYPFSAQAPSHLLQGLFPQERSHPRHHFQERIATTLLFSEPSQPGGPRVDICSCRIHVCGTGEDQGLSPTAFQSEQGKHVGNRAERQGETRCLGHLPRHTDTWDSGPGPGPKFAAPTQLSSGRYANKYIEHCGKCLSNSTQEAPSLWEAPRQAFRVS